MLAGSATVARPLKASTPCLKSTLRLPFVLFQTTHITHYLLIIPLYLELCLPETFVRTV